MNLIASIRGEPTKYTFKDQSVYSNTIGWLDKNRPELSNLRRTARGEIFDWLKNQGLSSNLAFRLAGKEPQSDSQTIPFYFIQFVDRKSDTDLTSQIKLVSFGSVNEVIDKLDSLATPTNIICVKKLNIDSLPELPPDIFNDRRATKELAVSLFGNELSVRLRRIYRNAPIQTMPDKFFFPVETELVVGPSYIELKTPSSPLNIFLIKLYQSDERKRYLRKTYGHMPIGEAQKIIADSLTQAYKRISILGFSFSTRKFPFAVVFFCLISLIATLLILRRPWLMRKTDSFDNQSDSKMEEPDSLLYGSIYLRAFIWIVLPVVSIFAAIPIIPITINEQILIYSSGAIIFLLGCTTVIISKDL
ncbi:MAG: hypothetical protein GY699_17300 [Desulfobacteraceae bacterium]|nr:hypothetical protein [Desulfobacteraceae bacterium]